MISPAAQLEALLFAHGAPLDETRIRTLCGWDEPTFAAAVSALRMGLEGRGLALQVWRDQYELVTVPEVAPLIRQFREEEARGELSKSALETLAILLYRGALTRPELEEVRGIHSHQMIRSLSLRGLITEQPQTRLGQPVYEVTPLCLQWLGLTGRQDLPDFGKFSSGAPVPVEMDSGADPVAL